MKNKIENLRQQYDNIEIPKELDSMLKKTISSSKKKRSNVLKYAVAAVAIISIGFTSAVNLNTSFADAISDIPVIGQLAKLVTFVESTEDDGILTVNLKVPAIASMEDKELEKKLNSIIMERVDAHVVEAKERAKEYKKAYVETGGNPDNFHDLTLDVSYEVLCSTPEKFSFKLSLIESMAAVYSEELYYNIDLKQQANVTLAGMLGDDYQMIIAKQVKEKINALTEEDRSVYFMDDVNALVIEPSQAFYLNEDGNVVVVFEKYTLAAGAAGRQFFEIIK